MEVRLPRLVEVEDGGRGWEEGGGRWKRLWGRGGGQWKGLRRRWKWLGGRWRTVEEVRMGVEDGGRSWEGNVWSAVEVGDGCGEGALV